MLTAKRFYRPELDLLRFGAFLIIFVHHSFPIPAGSGLANRLLETVKEGSALGVPLFFFLSAYLITELLLREKEKTGAISLKSFYIRRVLRIWPLYFGALALTVAISLFSSTTSIRHVSPEAILAFLFFRGNWWFGMGKPDLLYFGVLWSITVEEQFYLILPLLARSVSKRTLAYTSGAIWLAAQGFTWYAAAVWGMGSRYLRTNSMTVFQYFALGILACLFLDHAIPQRTKAYRSLMGIAGVFLFYWGEWLFRVIAIPGREIPSHVLAEFSINAVGVSMIFFAILGVRLGSVGGALAHLGRLSYGLYVFHFAIAFTVRQLAVGMGIHRNLVLLDWGISLPLTIGAAQLSYLYFESPFLRLKERFEVIKSRDV